MTDLQSISNRFRKAFGHREAWLLIVLGTFLFSSRFPLPTWEYISLPMVATVIQTAGLTFSVFGFQIMASIFVWPDINFAMTVDKAVSGNSMGAGLVALGLLLFNGLGLLAFILWLAPALGMVGLKG